MVGWIFGQEKRTRTVNNRVQTYYVDVERKIQKTYDNTFAACDISELGVQKVNLAGDEMRPVDFETPFSHIHLELILHLKTLTLGFVQLIFPVFV